jgi:hypothetical protein
MECGMWGNLHRSEAIAVAVCTATWGPEKSACISGVVSYIFYTVLKFVKLHYNFRSACKYGS